MVECDTAIARLQVPQVLPSLAHRLQNRQFLQALQGSAPVQVARAAPKEETNRVNSDRANVRRRTVWGRTGLAIESRLLRCWGARRSQRDFEVEWPSLCQRWANAQESYDPRSNFSAPRCHSYATCVYFDVEFVEAPAFSKLVASYLDDDSYRSLQLHLAEDPAAGDVIPSTGGFRKARWADPLRQKGKRGGLRVIYYHFAGDAQIWLMTLYGKGEVADLTPAEKRSLKAAVEKEVDERTRRRMRRKR